MYFGYYNSSDLITLFVACGTNRPHKLIYPQDSQPLIVYKNINSIGTGPQFSIELIGN